MTKGLIALFVSIPFIVQTPVANTKQIKAEIQTKQESSMDNTLYSKNLLIKQLEAKEKEYKEQQRKLAEQKRLKEIEEQKKRANVPQYVLNRGGNYKEITFILTFYTDLKEENGGHVNKTASGCYPKYGMVANNVITLGTVLYLDGFGEFIVGDRGGSNFNTTNRLDVYIPQNKGENRSAYRQRVFSMGKKVVKGYILE